MTELRLEQIAKSALDCCFRVHTALGPGLLESSYKACLAYELAEAGLAVKVEVPIPLVYSGQRLAEVGYRIDLLVEDELIIELKSVDTVLPVHRAQVLSYLRLSRKRLGLLINFNQVHLRTGISRVVNGM